MNTMVLKKLILPGLVLLSLLFLATMGTQISERQTIRRQAIREVADFRVQPQSSAGRRLTLPRLRHVVVRLRRAVRRRIHFAIHWLRVHRRHSRRFQT